MITYLNINMTVEEWLKIKEAFSGKSSINSRNQYEIVKGVSYPETKWYGPGNTASSYDDLGNDPETDKCFRTHDNCSISVDPGMENCGITNDGLIAL
jgi:hypothetical protein